MTIMLMEREAQHPDSGAVSFTVSRTVSECDSNYLSTRSILRVAAQSEVTVISLRRIRSQRG